MAEYLIQEKITIYDSVSPVFRHFATILKGNGNFPDLRLIRLGSEPVYGTDVELFKKVFSEHWYWPSRWASLRHFWFGSSWSTKTQIDGSLFPVGYQVEDKDILLLNDQGNDVGVNCVGEIAVRSRYLSPGYWSRPDLTAGVFLLTRQKRENGFIVQAIWGQSGKTVALSISAGKISERKSGASQWKSRKLKEHSLNILQFEKL